MIALLWIVLMTFLNGLTAFIGVISFFFSKNFFNKILLFLVSFSIGALLGGAAFHLIPESVEKLSLILTCLLIITGFSIFFLLETILHWRHCHEKECKIHPFTKLILYGDAIHNFIDGLIIASAFIISIPLGILTSILIISHELPQEIGDFAVLVYGGFKKKDALFYNFLAQLTSVLGGVIGYFLLSLIKPVAELLLPIAAGGFIYIAVNDLIPEIFREKSLKKIILNLIAIALGLLLLISARILVG